MNHRLHVLCLLILFILSSTFIGCSQNRPDQTFRIAFYNVENLFDTIPNPMKDDLNFTPGSRARWNTERYNKKLVDLAKVVEDMDHPPILGLAEVENALVLNDFCKAIGKPYYSFIHHESPDNRGIDVALLYQPEYFRPLADEALPLQIDINGVDRFTRDILYVTGIFLPTQDTLDLYINHWPSRRGGLAQSEHRRLAAADTLINHINLLKSHRHQPNIIIMGDFNDEPSNKSIKRIIDSQKNKTPFALFNAAHKAHKKGKGTYNYRGTWNMLDQFIISEHMTNTSTSGLKFYEFTVFDPPFLIFDHPRFGRTPNRTYGGPNYYGGTSDHLPIFMDIYHIDIDNDR